MKDYFTLLSVDCSPELRRRLDTCMHLAEHPTQEAYAQITPRYDGRCPLHLPDGRCALHAELGGHMLAAVCQLYPRGVRPGECSCANSCEAVPELLIHREEPLRFISLPLHFDLPKAAPRKHFFHTAGREQEIRLWLIAHLQNRAYPLSQRMLLMGEALHAVDQALTARDDARLHRLLSGEEAFSLPQPITPDRQQLLAGLDTAGQMLELVGENSSSIHIYGRAALAFFGKGEGALTHYQQAQQQLSGLIPHWETWFEHLLVNHMFFAQFPFQDRPVPLKDEYLALCAVYALLRFLCLGWLAQHPTLDDAVDVVSAAFRLIDHTEFDRYAAPLLKQLGCDDWPHIRQILSL